MHDFCVTCLYNDVLRFKKSAVPAATKKSTLSGISDSTGMVQVVADNFDADISKENGKLSTHFLAVLLTQSEYNPSEYTSDTPSTISRMSKTDW